MNNIIKFVLSNDKIKTEAVQDHQRNLTLPNYKFNNKKNQIIFDNLLKLKYLETKCINIFNESYVNQHF